MAQTFKKINNLSLGQGLTWPPPLLWAIAHFFTPVKYVGQVSPDSRRAIKTLSTIFGPCKKFKIFYLAGLKIKKRAK